ncbi:methyltransferase domain-containing protein [Nonomuraea roseola]|uniref:Methyltransferase domain-containing protein n=1 Tax=Nonomuraea roseola TaxID=46179 RepID=A0ABV5PUG6_9ACTN
MKLHHHTDHADGAGPILRPRLYEMVSEIGFAGRRRLVSIRLVALSGARRGDHVLDVGCGTGYLTRLLARRVGPEGHVTGLDVAQPMIEHARARAPGTCAYVLGEAQALPFPDARFDVLVSCLAVHHLPAAARGTALREMFRVLRPGGRLLIVELRPPANRLAARLAGVVAGHALRPSMPDLLAELVPAAGFRVEGTGELRPLLHYVRAVR